MHAFEGKYSLYEDVLMLNKIEREYKLLWMIWIKYELHAVSCCVGASRVTRQIEMNCIFFLSRYTTHRFLPGVD